MDIVSGTNALGRGVSVLLVTAGALLTACGRHEVIVDDGSDLRQLTQTLIKCVEYTADQSAANLQGMPDRFFRKETWRVGDVQRFYNALAGIPAPYLTWLYDVHRQNGFYMSQTALGGSVVGVTYFTDLPERINITTETWAADFATQHEVGHAIHLKLRRQPAFDRAMTQLFQAESQNPKLRAYARTQMGEYFAESFNNFYCSKEASDFVKAELPRTYDFLKTNLEKPRWETAAADPATLTKDVWLSLAAPASDGAGGVVEIAVADSLGGAAICKGEYAACVAAPRDDIRFAASDRQIAGRRVFKGATTLTAAAGQVLTLLAYDAAGKLAGARAVRLEVAY